MMRRTTAGIQNAMAGCLSTVIILAVLAGLATAIYETRTAQHATAKRAAGVSRTR